MRSFKKIAAMIMAVAMLCSFTVLGASVDIGEIGVNKYDVTIPFTADAEEVTALVYSGNDLSGANLVYIDQFANTYKIPTLTLDPGTYSVVMGGIGVLSADTDEFTVEDNTQSYTVSTTTDENGYIKCDKTGKVVENTEINITFAPFVGYELDTFKINGEDKTGAVTNGVYSYKHTVTANTEIAVTYKPITADSVAGDAYISGGIYDIAGETNPSDPRDTAASKLAFGKAVAVAGKTIKYMGMKVEVLKNGIWTDFTTPKGAGPLFRATNPINNVYGIRFFGFTAGTYKVTSYVQYEANGVVEEPVLGDSVEFEVR